MSSGSMPDNATARLLFSNEFNKEGSRMSLSEMAAGRLIRLHSPVACRQGYGDVAS